MSTVTLPSLPSASFRYLYSLETLLSGSQAQHSGQDLGMGNPEEIAMRVGYLASVSWSLLWNVRTKI